MLARAVPLALALIASVSAWLSLGVLAVVDRGTRARVGVLPPWWLLAALMAVFVLTVMLRRLPLVRVLPLALTIFPILPWLPGHIPAAFLIWYGPPAVLVWILVVLGLASPVLASVARQAWWRRPARAPWMAALAAAVMFGAGAFALQSRLPAGDEPHYLIITQSLLADGDLQIENNHTRGDYLPYFSGELRPDYLKRGQNGQIYSVHAPGLSAMLVPAFAVGGYPAAVAAVIMLSAIGVALLWTIVWELTGRASAAWFASAAWALSAPVYFHAFTVVADGVGAVGTLVGLWLLVRFDRKGTVGAGRLVATGAVLAIHPWLHTRFAVIAGAIGLVLTLRLLARPDRVRCIGWLMA
ncbi:MAG: hypothetical protein OEW19_21985, partial [Acidobacteriota bacterium]|nr:hypothetical protein [Acidobacteriota bacterium]